MTNNNGLKDTRLKPVADPAQAEEKSIANEGRRRLAKAGLLAPVVLTLLSRPAWGGAQCWSGMMSGNTSGHEGDSCAYGYGPEYWLERAEIEGGWPNNYLPGDTFFDRFGNNIFGEDATLRQILEKDDLYEKGPDWLRPDWFQTNKTDNVFNRDTSGFLVFKEDKSLSGGDKPLIRENEPLENTIPINVDPELRRLGRYAIAALLNTYEINNYAIKNPQYVIDLFNNTAIDGATISTVSLENPPDWGVDELADYFGQTFYRG